MNVTELTYFKAYLLDQKSSILNKTVEFKNQQLHSEGNVSDEAEAASKDLSMNLSIHLHERDRNALFAIEKALGKISEGTYGLCESCRDSIEVKRLKARPFASMCIQCMEEQEDPKNFLN